MDTDYIKIHSEDITIGCYSPPVVLTACASDEPILTQVEPLIIGNSENFWLWRKEDGFDLTHPPTPTSDPVTPRLMMEAFNAKVTISPKKTAIVIVDMQNYWLSEPFSQERGPAHDAENVLLLHGLPAARKAGIQVVWLNLGISDEDLKTLPPTTARMFSFHADGHHIFNQSIGNIIGPVKLASGEIVEAGRFLMKGQWNTMLHAPLEKAFQESLDTSLPDVKFSKIRITGMTDVMQDCSDFLT